MLRDNVTPLSFFHLVRIDSDDELVFRRFVNFDPPLGFIGQELFLQELVELAVGTHSLVSLQSHDVLILERIELRLALKGRNRVPLRKWSDVSCRRHGCCLGVRVQVLIG